jgi:hypothetical protein
LHIVHLSKGLGANAPTGPNKLFASAMGIIFDTKAAAVDAETTAAIDGFFESMQLDKGKETAAIGEIKLANMMKYVDLNNRWAYKGSLTTPPCTKTVYFNVMRKVWPLKQKHLDQFRNLMKKHGQGYFFTKADGNHRVVQPVNTQDPVLIVNSINIANTGLRALFVAFLALFIIALCAFGIACFFCMRAQASSKVMVPNASVD